MFFIYWSQTVIGIIWFFLAVPHFLKHPTLTVILSSLCVSSISREKMDRNSISSYHVHVIIEMTALYMCLVMWTVHVDKLELLFSKESADFHETYRFTGSECIRIHIYVHVCTASVAFGKPSISLINLICVSCHFLEFLHSTFSCHVFVKSV